ncbi:uncharacterized protein EDB93DRAFT_1265834 [Suillus bovinus]|uniref:uncharacterized protein n=1 Tax=Suillus bovinus TaxID=48563 RepID=UPI001B85B69D|nr:uncharacterized protein EDB93DRAFT_1265834 [Suillus bovinus]KAG2129198.1 hypothetical protein EDB93DRAFT_1265834 [Suillus bovinus]
MNVDRRNDRRAKRTAHSSPYARPTKHSKPVSRKKSLWSISGLMSFLRFGGAEEDDRAEDLVRSSASSSSNDEDEDLQIQEQEGPPHIPTRQVQLDRNSAPEFVLPLPPGDVPPGHEPSQELVYPPAWDAQQPGPSNTSQFVTPARQPFYNLNTPPHQTNIPSYLQQSPSLAKNLEPVTRFLVEKAGRPLNEFEAAGIVDYIQKNVQADKPEPFRFSTSPSRGSSPNLGFGTPNGVSSNTHVPKKTLLRNPNGILRWQGAGSARPRNRYRSPGFGSRPQGPRIELSPIRTPSATDAKRRRVGNEAESSTAQKSSPPSSTSNIVFPTSNSTSPTRSTPVINDKTLVPPVPVSALAPAAVVTPKANGTTTPRLRTAGLAVKPTTPAVPSPLRQTWKQNDSPPQPPARPTRAANYMTGLIKEVTPVKKPDVANPYQTASPVKMPIRKPPVRRSRPPAEKKEKPQKEPEITAQAIIEATVPKGSKRARPPPEIERQEKPTREAQDTYVPKTNGHSKTAKPMVITEEVADQDESPTKKQKTAKLTPVVLSVEEVEDVEMVQDKSSVFTRPVEIIEPVEDAPSSLITPSATPFPFSHTPSPALPMKTAFGTKTSAPREPSKLRYSYYADKETTSAEEKPISEAPPAQLITSCLLPKETQTTSSKAKLPPKEAVAAMEVDELPKYKFNLAEAAYPAGPSHVKARITATSMSRLSLPVFEFKPVAPSTNGFNWTAAGMKVPAATTSGTWSCGTCMLENPASAEDKCTICDAPRSGSAAQPAAAPQKMFDWSKAAIKMPLTEHVETWQCDTCMLSNPDSAKLECTVCDAARPGAASSPAPTGFNWSAAGLKVPGSSMDTWTCSLCMLKVPTSATKCTVCDTARDTMD